MDKIFKTLDSINTFSKKVILGASMFAVAGCNVGIVLIVYNRIVANEVELYALGSSLIQKSISVFFRVFTPEKSDN